MKRTPLNPIGKVRKRRGSAQKRAMEQFLKTAGWNCWHCGQHIGQKKVSNAAHVFPKSRYPELACDPGNFYLLRKRRYRIVNTDYRTYKLLD